MRKLFMLLAMAIFLVVGGCATTPTSKSVDNTYYNNKYKFSLEKPAGWVYLKEVPKHLLAEMLPVSRETVKIVLADEHHCESLIIIGARRIDCSPQDIPIVVRVTRKALIAKLKDRVEVKTNDIKCYNSIHLTKQDTCVGIRTKKEGGLNYRINIFTRFYPVESHVNVLIMLFASSEQVYNDQFSAFLNVVNSLRCGDKYSSVLD